MRSTVDHWQLPGCVLCYLLVQRRRLAAKKMWITMTDMDGNNEVTEEEFWGLMVRTPGHPPAHTTTNHTCIARMYLLKRSQPARVGERMKGCFCTTVLHEGACGKAFALSQ